MWTVIGADGFIGSSLVASLRSLNEEVTCVNRANWPQCAQNLGHIVYCAGMTADFRKRPYDTVDSHVTQLANLLQMQRFDSFLYLSSTRVYAKSVATNCSDEFGITVNPQDPSDLYNISKLMGESLCLQYPSNTVRVARLSNIVGEKCNFAGKNFLDSIVSEALRTGKVYFQTAAESEKDFLSISDLMGLIPRVALYGRSRIYNLASGINISNRQIAAALKQELGITVRFAEDGSVWKFPAIDVSSLKAEFDFLPTPFIDWFYKYLSNSTRVG